MSLYGMIKDFLKGGKTTLQNIESEAHRLGATDEDINFLIDQAVDEEGGSGAPAAPLADYYASHPSRRY